MTPTLTVLSSFTTLTFSGTKTTDFLQGQLTCDVRLLAQHGAHSLAAVCDHRGSMLANFWVVRWHDDFLLVLQRELCNSVKNHLQKYAVFSRVVISQNDDFFIAELNHYSSEKNNDTLFISLPSHHRFLILSEKNHLTQVKINTDETEWKKNNIVDQLCILYVKTSLLFTPQMIGLEKLGGVSFNKGCYVGQEIIARIEYLGTLKRHLRQLQIQSDQPLFPGDSLKNNHDEPVGVVVEAVKFTENAYEILAVMRD